MAPFIVVSRMDIARMVICQSLQKISELFAMAVVYGSNADMVLWQSEANVRRSVLTIRSSDTCRV
ncbi:hypothetical protein SAHY_02852 [Salinisphaera hydrothermalis EPR70]